jgi:hypothetical protein
MKAKAVRGVAMGIGGMTGAGVATVSFMGDCNAVAAKKAGDVASITIRKIIKRHMLKLDNFNANENTDNSANGIVDDLAGETVDTSPDCQNASDTANESVGDLEGDTSDDLTDNNINCENVDDSADDSADDLVDDSADDTVDDCDDQ